MQRNIIQSIGICSILGVIAIQFFMWNLINEGSPSMVMQSTTQTGSATTALSTNFPKGIGQSLVIQRCTICHSEETILQNQMSRDYWDDTISTMREKNNMPALNESERKIILNYLDTYLGLHGQDGIARPGLMPIQ